MKENEFRIGNLMSIGLDIGIVTDISRDGVVKIQKSPDTWVSAPIERFEPVPLIEELLVGFGAIEETSKSGVMKVYRLNGIKFEISNSGNIYHSQSRKPVHFVHRLQNLMFELTDVELTLKSE